MNKITTIGIPIHGLTGLVLFALFFNSRLSAQETYTTIRKNVNPLAYNLNHNLSSAQDSLLLDNKFLFKRVRFISDESEKVFDFKPAVKRAKIPLDELPLGNYTVMFYQADKIIVFQIERLLPFDSTRGAKADAVAMITSDRSMDNINELDPIEIEDKVESIQVGLSLDSNIGDFDLATYDSSLDIDDGDLEEMMKSYNLSDLDRNNVQTRSAYRRQNLRPNGKPYAD